MSEKYINFVVKTKVFFEIKFNKIFCFFGYHDWTHDRVSDYLSKGVRTHKCWYCFKWNDEV